MKLFFQLLLISLFLVSSVFSQDYQSFTAKEAYNYAKTEGLLSGKILIGLTAYEMQESNMFQMNVPEGTATNWSILMKSQNVNDIQTYVVIIFKTLNEYFSLDDFSDIDAQSQPSLDNFNWLNSDAIGAKVKNSGDFYTFYLANLGNFSFNEFNLVNIDTIGADTNICWVVDLQSIDSLSAECIYKADTGENISCFADLNSIKAAKNILIKYFPNPTKGYINFETELFGLIDINVFDNLGNSVYKERRNIENNFQLDLSSLPNGFYNIILSSRAGTKSKKIIIYK